MAKKATFTRNGKILAHTFQQYLVPTIFSGLSIMLGVVVDGIIVGNTIGADAMAAISVAQPLVLVFQAVFFLFGLGSASLIAVCKGEHKVGKANAVFTTGILGLLLSSFVFVLLGAFFLNTTVTLLCSDSSLFELTKSYIQVLLLGAPLMLFVPGVVYIIRTDGFPRFSANILFLANTVNLVMDLVYIKVFGLGIAGAALATLTGYAVGMVLVLHYYFSKKRSLRFEKPSTKLLPEIVGSALAGSVNTLLIVLRTFALNHIVMSVGGAVAMSVYAVCSFSITFITMFSRGAADTMVPILGMLYGERDWTGIRFLLKRTFYVLFFCLSAAVLLIELFSEQILLLYNITDPATMAMGTQALRVFAISLIGLGISFTLMYYMQTIKHRAISLTISLLRGLLLIVPLAYLLSQVLALEGVWLAYVLTEIITIFITLLMCKATQMRNKNRYSSFLLFEKQPENEAIYDITLQSEAGQAVLVSADLIEFCKQKGLSAKQANLIGLMAEETVMTIAQFNENGIPHAIDFLCRIEQKEVVLSFRDNGKPFNATPPPKQEKEPSFDSITVLRSIAKSVQYTRSLGMNNTLLILDREDTSFD